MTDNNGRALREAKAPDVEVLVDIGEKAVSFVTARAARMAARRERNRVAGDWTEEHGSDARYHEDSHHPQGFSKAFLRATGDTQRAYMAALAEEKSARQRLYAAVKKRVRVLAVGEESNG